MKTFNYEDAVLDILDSISTRQVRIETRLCVLTEALGYGKLIDTLTTQPKEIHNERHEHSA